MMTVAMVIVVVRVNINAGLANGWDDAVDAGEDPVMCMGAGKVEGVRSVVRNSDLVAGFLAMKRKVVVGNQGMLMLMLIGDVVVGSHSIVRLMLGDPPLC